MKLKTHLRETTPERLQSIARYWDLAPADLDSSDQSDALAEYLYPRMQTPGNFRQMFDQLNAEQREWVYLLAIHGGELPVEEFKKRARIESPEQFESVQAALVERGFIWFEKVRDPLIKVDLIGIPEPFVRLIELPPYWQGFLGFYLQSMGTDELRNLARHSLDERPSTRKKQVLVHYLRKKLTDPKTLRESIERRDGLQVEMFEHILSRNGVCVWRELLDSGLHKKFDHVRAERLRDLVENSGLVFVLKAASNKYNNLLMVPRDLAYIIQNGYKRDERTLQELSRSGPDSTAATPESIMRPGVILDNSNNVLRDLIIVCSYIQRHSVKMLNNGGLGRNDLKKIVPLLSHNKTPKYVSFLALFAISKKLLISVGDQWRVSSSLLQWLGRGQSCFRDLYEFWLLTNDWNEEFIDGDVVHADNYPQNLIGITELRKLVLRMLEKLPADTWIDFETFAESLLPQIAIEIPGRFDVIPTDKHNRHPILIMESIVAESLYWLGVIVLGASDLDVSRKLGSRPNEAIAPYDPGHRLSSRLIGDKEYLFGFRLTEFGRTLLSRPYLDIDKLFHKMPRPELPYADQSDHITVQPNLEIVAPPDLALDKFFKLLQFTTMKKMDIMTTMSISPDSVRAGMDQGLSADQMISILRESSRRDLPETVVQMITECQSRHGEVDMGLAGGYMRISDKMRMEEVKANSKIAPAIKDIYGDELVLLSRSADFKKIARELQKMGFMPRIDSESLYETKEGLFQVTLQAEELYDLLAVLRFAILVDEENSTNIFEDRVRPLFQRLSFNAQERFNPKFYAESIAKTFQSNFEKATKKLIDEATRKYRKQLNRLIKETPRTRRASSPELTNPATEQADVVKLIKHAIEQEIEIRIHYVKSSGETVSQTVEPEAIQAGTKVYAYCPGEDEHHFYLIERIHQASI